MMRVVVHGSHETATRVRQALAIAGITAVVIAIAERGELERIEKVLAKDRTLAWDLETGYGTPTVRPVTAPPWANGLPDLATIRMRYNARGRRWRPFPDPHFPLATRVSDREFFTHWFRRARVPDHLVPPPQIGARARGFSRARGGPLRHHFRRRRHTTGKAPRTRCSPRSLHTRS